MGGEKEKKKQLPSKGGDMICKMSWGERISKREKNGRKRKLGNQRVEKKTPQVPNLPTKYTCRLNDKRKVQ